MATRDKKQMVRINPELANEVATIAKRQKKAGYQLLEEIVREWLEKFEKAQHLPILKKAEEQDKNQKN